jgi:hypothetical protein
MDDPADFLTSEAAYTIVDSLGIEVTGPDYPIGIYTIHLSGLEQGESANYDINYSSATLTVNPPTIYVVAGLSGISQFDSLPPFPYAIEGYPTDPSAIVVDDPSFFLVDSLGQEHYPPNNPFNHGLLPGLYEVHPYDIQLIEGYDWDIVYVPNLFYINPQGPNAISINIAVECIKPLQPSVGDFNKEVIFSYTNNNPITLYVPYGERNYAQGTDYMVELPEFFEPGTHYFSAYTDPGTDVQWTLATYQSQNLDVNIAAPQNGPNNCPNHLKLNVDEVKNTKCVKRVWPNPTQDAFVIELLDGVQLTQPIRLYDMLGSEIPVEVVVDSKSGQLRVSLEDRSNGLYLVRVYTDCGMESLRILKD